MPDAAGALGAIAVLEARADGCGERRVMDRAVADRAIEPGVQA